MSSKQPTSEHLARRWFGLVRDRDLDGLCALLHDDVVFVSTVRGGEVVEGGEAAAALVRETLTTSIYDVVADEYLPLDEGRIVVDGRLRWIDDDRVIRDDPALWALEFRDGLLVRFLPARTTVEAETLLATPATSST